MMMSNRKYQTSSYRYSINKQEKETDVNENITTALYWEYDSRIGRRWNVDPIYKHSPYSAFGNNPLIYTDRSGLDTVKNWQDAKKGDVWGSHTGGSTFW